MKLDTLLAFFYDIFNLQRSFTEQLGQIIDDAVGNGFIHRVICPLFATHPHCLTASFPGRYDVFVYTVAHDDYFIGPHAQRLDTQGEDAWIRLANAYHG